MYGVFIFNDIQQPTVIELTCVDHVTFQKAAPPYPNNWLVSRIIRGLD